MVSPGPRAPELGSGLRSLHELDDAALAARVADGDPRAFEALYDRHRPDISRYCSALVRNPQDAEEALQLTMLAAYRSLSSGSLPRVALRPWLFRIAHNECMDLLRERPRVEELTDRHDPVAGALHERVVAREQLRELNADIAALPLRQRAAFVLHELSGLSHAAVGEAIGTTETDARRLLHEARTSLSEYRAGRGLDCGEVRARIVSGDRRLLRARSISAHLRACAPCRAAEAAAAPRRMARRLVLAATAVVVVGMILAGVRAFAAIPGATTPAAAPAAATTAAAAGSTGSSGTAPSVAAAGESAAASIQSAPPSGAATRAHSVTLPTEPIAPDPEVTVAPAPALVAEPAPAAAPPPASAPVEPAPAPAEPSSSGSSSGLAAAPEEEAPAPTPHKGLVPEPSPPVTPQPSEPTPAPTPGGEEVPEEPGVAPEPPVVELVPAPSTTDDGALTAAPEQTP